MASLFAYVPSTSDGCTVRTWAWVRVVAEPEAIAVAPDEPPDDAPGSDVADESLIEDAAVRTA